MTLDTRLRRSPGFSGGFSGFSGELNLRHQWPPGGKHVLTSSGPLGGAAPSDRPTLRSEDTGMRIALVFALTESVVCQAANTSQDVARYLAATATPHALSSARVVDLGSQLVPDSQDWDTVLANGGVLNESLRSLAPGDTLVIPNKTYYLMGGIGAVGLNSVVIQIDGTLAFASTALHAEKYIHEWPRFAPAPHKKVGTVHSCINLTYATNVTITSSGMGTLDGDGAKWWGIPLIGYAVRQENRPRLFHCLNCTVWHAVSSYGHRVLLRTFPMDVAGPAVREHSAEGLAVLDVLHPGSAG